MKNTTKYLLSLLVIFGLGILLGRQSISLFQPEQSSNQTIVQTTDLKEDDAQGVMDESWTGGTKEQVALYIHTYGKLPSNYMTKKQAKRQYGWSGGPLHEYEDGLCIGGDSFSNYEGQLPEKSGRRYYECDIDTLSSSSRGPKRIVFSNDGLVYYTSDHYESFELLYGEKRE